MKTKYELHIIDASNVSFSFECMFINTKKNKKISLYCSKNDLLQIIEDFHPQIFVNKKLKDNKLIKKILKKRKFKYYDAINDELEYLYDDVFGKE